MKRLCILFILAIFQLNAAAQSDCEILVSSSSATDKLSMVGDRIEFANPDIFLPFQIFEDEIYYLNRSSYMILKSDASGNLSDTILLDSNLPTIIHFNVISDQRIFLFGNEEAFTIDHSGGLLDTITNLRASGTALRGDKLFFFERNLQNLSSLNINNFQLDSLRHFEGLRVPNAFTSNQNDAFLKIQFDENIYRIAENNELEVQTTIPNLSRIAAAEMGLFIITRSLFGQEQIQYHDFASTTNTELFKIESNPIQYFGILDAECIASFTDADQDGFAEPVDCNDVEAAIFPGQIEVAGNEIDDNCNGIIDDDSDCDIDISVSYGCDIYPSFYVNIEGGEAPFIIEIFESGNIRYSDTIMRNYAFIDNIAQPDNSYEVEVKSNFGCFGSESLDVAPSVDCIFNVDLTSDADGTTLLTFEDFAFDLIGCQSYAYINIKQDGVEVLSGDLPLVVDLIGAYTFEVYRNLDLCFGNLTIEGDEVVDVDGDGFASDEDCNDLDSLINPIAEEIPNNEIDENCDGELLIIDEDMDGFNSDEDCDDLDSLINPIAEEIPNNEIDENCDGELLIIDEDMDGFNSDEDCNDLDSLINPIAEEIPNNEIDENCDGELLIIDEDMDGFNSDEDCNDLDSLINPMAEEIPNNEIDENCDGEDLVSSNDDTAIKTSIDIYPNPSTGRLIMENKYKHIVKLRFYRIDGSLYDSYSLRQGQRLAIDSMDPGMYLIFQEKEDSLDSLPRKLLVY